MVHKDENGKLTSVSTATPKFTPEGVEYVTMSFMMEFKNDLLEILEIKFKAIDKRFDAMDRRFDGIDKKIDESNRRIDRLITQNALEHHGFDVRIASLGA